MSVYAISDIHGCFDIYEQVTKFIKPEDKVYCLGDCGDRGPRSWETIIAVAQNPQFVYLKGNHEDMLVDAMRCYLDETDPSDYQDALNLILNNGGGPTFLSWIEDEQASREWMIKLKKLPLFTTYTNKNGQKIFMTHAGAHPDEITHHACLWNRDFNYLDKLEKNQIIVHGHTPIPYLAELYGIKGLEPGAFWYDNNQRVNIDYGTYATGYSVLLDLDTFDEHIFESPSILNY